MIIKSVSKLDKLKEHVQKTKQDLERDRELQKQREERTKLISDAPEWTTMDFWCSSCREDLTTKAYKVVQADWTVKGQQIAFYEAYRACHKRLRRYITDKHTDPYFLQSEMLRRQQIDHELDFLAPFDPRFRLKYGDPNKKLYEAMEAEERANYQKKIMTPV